MNTNRNTYTRRLLAALSLGATLLAAESAGAFEIQDLMSRYNQVRVLAMTEAARSAGLNVDPSGFLESVRGGSFAALLPIRGGAEATREQWVLGRDVAVVALRFSPMSEVLPEGLYVLHVRVIRGEAHSALIPIGRSGVPIWGAATSIQSPTGGAGCGSGIEVGEGFVCIRSCWCEFYLGQHVCGTIATCFTI